MATAYVYGIKDPQVPVSGIVTDFHVTSSGTEQDLPGQTSCEQTADTGVSDIKTTVDFTVRGGAVFGDTLKGMVGSKVHVKIDSEDACPGSNNDDRESVTLEFDIKITNVDVTAKQRDWWDTKITGTVIWS